MNPDHNHSMFQGESGMRFKYTVNENDGSEGHNAARFPNAANRLHRHGTIPGGRYMLTNRRTFIDGQGGDTVTREYLVDSENALANSKKPLIKEPASPIYRTGQRKLRYPSRGKMFATIAIFFLSLIPVARAADDGDDFTNNLFSDLAPILALFGEQVAKQFMSESSGWADNILFAMAPLGVITGIVSAIRVAGHPWLKALVGRGREGLAQAELELMSSNSADVGEMWNGQAVVRVLGKPSIFQFVYTPDNVASDTASPTKKPKPQTEGTSSPNVTELDQEQQPQGSTESRLEPITENTLPPNINSSYPSAHAAIHSGAAPLLASNVLDRPEGGTTEIDLTRKIDILRDNNALFKRRGAETISEPSTDRGHEWYDNNDIEMRPLLRLAAEPDNAQEISIENRPPNISLNSRGKLMGDREKWSITALAVAAQLVVVIFDYFITYNEHLKTRFLKRGAHPSSQAFPCTIFGTLCLNLGMLLCSYVVDSASLEETWVLKDKSSNCKVAWVQKGGTVNDQEFEPYLIFGYQGQQKIITSHRCHQRDQLKLRSWILIATFASIVGFVTQFIGLRGMHWSATIAQLAATAFVTALRSFARRRMSKEPMISRAVKGYELDCMARKLRDCVGWKLISEIPHSIPAESRDSFARSVMLTRSHLGRLSGWSAEVQHVADALCSSMEKTLNYIHQTRKVQLPNSATESLEFRFTLAALALKEEHPTHSPHPFSAPSLLNGSAQPAPSSYHYSYLPFHLTRPGRWGQWKMSEHMRQDVSTVLSLMKLHSVEEESYYNKGKISPHGKDLDDILGIAQVLPWPSHAMHRRLFGLWMGSNDIEVLRESPKDVCARDAAFPIPSHRIIGKSGTGDDPHLAIHPRGSVKKLFAQEIFSTFLSELLPLINGITGPAERLLNQHRLQGLRHDTISQLVELLSETGLGTRQEINMLLITHLGDHKLLPPPDKNRRACEAHFRIERALRKSRVDNKWDLTASYILNLFNDYSAPLDLLAAEDLANPRANLKVEKYDVRYMVRRFITRLTAFVGTAEEDNPEKPNHSKALFLQWLRDIDINVLKSLPTPLGQRWSTQPSTPVIDELIYNAKRSLNPGDCRKVTILLERFIPVERKGDLADDRDDHHRWNEVDFLRRLMYSQNQEDIEMTMKEATEHRYIALLEALFDFNPYLRHPEINWVVIADSSVVCHFLTQLFWYSPTEYRQFQIRQQPRLLLAAAYTDNQHRTRELVKHSMRESAEHYLQTCLILAAWNDSRAIVEDMLISGANVNGCVTGGYNMTLLLTSFGYQDKWLRHEWNDDGIMLMSQLTKGPMTGSRAKGDYHRVVDEFLRVDNSHMAIGAVSVRTALQAAAEAGNSSMVAYLLKDKSATVNTAPSGRSWRSALQAAAGAGHLLITAALLKAGADVNEPAWGYSGRTALQGAAESGDLGVVEILLSKGADRDGKAAEFNGLSALAAAAKGGSLKVLNRLSNIHPRIVDQEDRQALERALRAAAGGGYLEIVNRLLELGANPIDPNTTPNDDIGSPALTAAAQSGHLTVVNRLLEWSAENADIANGEKHDLESALRAAAGGGYLEVVNRLLDLEADPDATSSRPWPSTSATAKERTDLAVMELALEEEELELTLEVNAAAVSLEVQTALQAAAGGGHLAVVNRLLESCADVNAPACDYNGRTALQAAAEGGHITVVDRLLESDAEVNGDPAMIRGRTALQAAAGGSYQKDGDQGPQPDTDIDANTVDDSAPIALQATPGKIGCLAVVNLLLEHHANVNAMPSPIKGRTALQAAAEMGNLVIVNRLLDCGGQVNAPPAEQDGLTALQAAAMGGHLAVVDILLERGAEVNAPPAEGNGRTALQAAAEKGNLSVVELLLKHGAEVNADPALKAGRTALQAAARGGHLAVVDLLLEHKGKVNAPPCSKAGLTALQEAARGGHLAITKRLLEHDADVNAAPAIEDGLRALEAAQKGGYEDISELLISSGAK